MNLKSIQEEINREHASLDEERLKEVEAKWAAESEERIDAVNRGELQIIDGPSALRDLRARDADFDDGAFIDLEGGCDQVRVVVNVQLTQGYPRFQVIALLETLLHPADPGLNLRFGQLTPSGQHPAAVR